MKKFSIQRFPKVLVLRILEMHPGGDLGDRNPGARGEVDNRARRGLAPLAARPGGTAVSVLDARQPQT